MLQNVGTKPARFTVTARVGDAPVQAVPPHLDLLTNTAPTSVHIYVPRPKLGDLVKAFNSAATLYGDELVVEVTGGKRKKVATWREDVYTPGENAVRYEIQQRIWQSRSVDIAETS